MFLAVLQRSILTNVIMTLEEKFKSRQAYYHATKESELEKVDEEKRKHYRVLNEEMDNMSHGQMGAWIDKLKDLRQYEDFLKSL